MQKANEVSLLSKDNFYSKLKQDGISDIECNQALNDWKDIDCETINDDPELFLKTAVLLMLDLFEKFKALC